MIHVVRAAAANSQRSGFDQAVFHGISGGRREPAAMAGRRGCREVGENLRHHTQCNTERLRSRDQ